MTAPGLFGSAVAALRQGDLLQALSTCRRALRLFPGEAEGWRLLALIQRARGYHAAALAAMEQALHLNPAAPLLYTEKANLLSEMGQLKHALSVYQQALQRDPTYWPACLNLGHLLAESRDFYQAHRYYLQVLQAEPFQFQALLGAFECLRRLGQYQQAEALLQPVLQVDCWTTGERARLYCQYGVLLHDQGLLDAALQMQSQALALVPDLADAWFNRGSILQEMGQRLAARKSYQQALVLDSQLSEARLNLALLDLSEEQWSAGFAGLAWRHSCQDAPALPQGKLWRGENLKASRILVTGEYGQGDILLFARFLRPLLQIAAQVKIQVPAALEPLLAEIPGLQLSRPISAADYDCILPLLDLPRALSLSPKACTPPYLWVPSVGAEWKIFLGPQQKIGFCWHGQLPEQHLLPASRRIAARKALSLEFFYRLALEFEGSCRFFSLQWPAELPQTVQPLLTDLAPHIKTWRDTAQWIQALDLVITADTAVAHLAGALGKPVWILLPEPIYWIWPAAGDTFAWYPQARLFRQCRAGDWQTLWPVLKQALCIYLHTGMLADS